MRNTPSSLIPRHDSTTASKELLRASGAARQIERRLFLKQGLSLGALTLLTGCDVTDTTNVQRVLNGISEWNDRTQAAIFNPRRLMPTYPESRAIKDFRYNAYFGQSQVPKVDGASYKLNLSGLVGSRKPWTLDELYALPQESQVTRHVCVEGWSMIGKWTGVPFRTFLQRIGADTTAKYVGFECADGYYSSIDMASALHPQTFLTFKISDEILAPRYGYPLKLRIPTKLGFKNPKWIMAMYVTNRFLGGFWEDRGYNWLGGVGERSGHDWPFSTARARQAMSASGCAPTKVSTSSLAPASR